jgi:hypothetical protein
MTAHPVKPGFIAQNGDLSTRLEQDDWIKRTVDYMVKEHGATFFRVTRHKLNADLILIEGWKVQPINQGEPHFQMERVEAFPT